ncbi:MAG: amidohydrolase, partial [Bryocella sp.]
MLRVEGRIVNHDAEFDGGIVINTDTGLITSVERAITGRSDLDTTNCLIFPGFGDIHIHAREDVSGTQMYKEDFATASA